MSGDLYQDVCQVSFYTRHTCMSQGIYMFKITTHYVRSVRTSAGISSKIATSMPSNSILTYRPTVT